MKDKIHVKGNNPIVISNVRGSRISLRGKDQAAPDKGLLWTVAGTIIALVAWLTDTMIGWKDLLKFFEHK